jgi:hypothetical protein
MEITLDKKSIIEVIRWELDPLTCKIDWKTIIEEGKTNNGKYSENTIATRDASK